MNNEKPFNALSRRDKFFYLICILISALVLTIAPVVSCASSGEDSKEPFYASILNMNKEKQNKKVVMLTFDDGPLDFNTEKGPGTPGTKSNQDDEPYIKNHQTIDDEILDVLKNKGKELGYSMSLPGTFFEEGKHVIKRKDNPDITTTMNRIINEGSWIGSHSYSHDKFAGKTEEYFFDDIKKSYDLIDEFYREYFTSTHAQFIPKYNEVKVSKDSISKLELGELNQDDIDIPLRLGYLQKILFESDFKEQLGIKQLICGFIGDDWKETDNASDSQIEKYFNDNKLGDYHKLKKQFENDANDNDPKKAEYEKNLWEAKKAITQKLLWKQYEDEATRIDAYIRKHNRNIGFVLCLHTRTFTKYYLPQLIDWLAKDGYSFVGMNPFYKETYYKNWGEFDLSKHRELNGNL